MSKHQDVFKVTLPLGQFLPTDGNDKVRINNRGGQIAFTLPVTREVIRLFEHANGLSSVHVRGQWDDITGDINLGPVINGLKW